MRKYELIQDIWADEIAEPYMASFGRRVTEMRKEKGLTQAALPGISLYDQPCIR